VSRLRDDVQHHASERMGGVAQHAAGNPVQAGKVGDGVDHRDI